MRHVKDSILEAPFQNSVLLFADCAANVVHLRAYSWSAEGIFVVCSGCKGH